MKERSLILSSPEVRATIEGRKTMHMVPVKTRHRLGYIGPAGCENDPESWGWPCADGWMVLAQGFDGKGGDSDLCSISPPLGSPGEVVRVKEPWGKRWEVETDPSGCFSQRNGAFDIIYRADGRSADEWLSAAAMPACFSRLSLRITDVRVLRVQEVTEEQAVACGFTMADAMRLRYPTVRDALMQAWDDKYLRHPWSGNPWAWAYTWEVMKADSSAGSVVTREGGEG